MLSYAVRAIINAKFYQMGRIFEWFTKSFCPTAPRDALLRTGLVIAHTPLVTSSLLQCALVIKKRGTRWGPNANTHFRLL